MGAIHLWIPPDGEVGPRIFVVSLRTDEDEARGRRERKGFVIYDLADGADILDHELPPNFMAFINGLSEEARDDLVSGLWDGRYADIDLQDVIHDFDTERSEGRRRRVDDGIITIHLLQFEFAYDALNELAADVYDGFVK